jgi:hypothetical protein
MANSDFLSRVFVAALLGFVAILVALSALTVVPFNVFGRRYVVAFWICVLAIWAWAVFMIVLLRHAIAP